jgi:inhibitor of cysteine peptidase
MKTNRHRLILIHSRHNLLPRYVGAVLLSTLVSLPFCGLAADAPRVTTKPGRQFSITLESNPTTGYQWQLAKPVTGTCVALVTNQFLRPKSKLTGAPGKEVWKFKALRPGEAQIELQYVRSWEKGVEPAQKTNLAVVVTASTPAK